MKKILIWAPAPSNEDKNTGSFIASRIYELQKLGYQAEVLQYGRLHICSHAIQTKRKDIIGIIAQLKHYFFFFIKFRLYLGQNKKKYFKSISGSYIYYDSLNFKSYNDFIQWYNKQGYMLIHCHFLWFAEPLPYLKKKYNIKYVITAHGSDIHETPFLYHDKAKIFKEIMHRADRVIFVSNFLLQKSTEFGYDKKNYVVIYNGYNPDIFYPAVQQKKIDTHNLILGFIGHPIRVKRVDIFPEVLKTIKQSYPNTKLIMLGSTKDKTEDLIPQIKTDFERLHLLDSVIFIDEVPPEKVGEFLQKIDILLFPSLTEGFGCVVIEAQACGTPVIGSANGGIPEAVGTSGICVPESDSFTADFAQAVIKYCKNPIPPMDIINRAQSFTWQNIVKQEIQVYEEL